MGLSKSWYGQLLFLLLFSGPPKFRVRDPESSLYGEVDWVVILHILVWGAAGLWVLWHIVSWIRARRRVKALTTSAKLATLLAFCLLFSASASGYQSLVLFKSYQFMVCVVFAAVFTYEYGIERTVGLIFWGSFSLCVLISLAAIWAPDMVWVQSELEAGRLRGDLEKGKEQAFEETPSYLALRRVYREQIGSPLPTAILPELELKSPKLRRGYSTAAYARNVLRHHRACLQRLRGE